MKKRIDKKTAARTTRTLTIWTSIAVLSALTLAAYCNSFSAPMVFDDMVSIQINETVRSGTFDWRVRPRGLLYLTFTLNYIWTGQAVWSYHLLNFLLHVFNGLLVFCMAERLLRRVEMDEPRSRWYALAASAFFLVHPVQTESVTYISSRSELLSTLFYLTGFLIFISWPRERVGFLCNLVVAVPLFLGLVSKETVITLPAMLFVYDFLFWSGARLRPMLSRWRFYSIYALGAGGAVYYILTVAQRQALGEGTMSSWGYFLTQLRVIVRYVQLVFLPIGLNLDYDFSPSSRFTEPGVVASFIFLTGVVVLGWVLRRSAPIVAFSIFWFFITLSPTSSVVPLPDVIFEHRLYLPLAGLCLSFPVFVSAIHETLRRRIALPGPALGYCAVIISILIAGTVIRNYTWNDEIRLFTDVVAKSPAKDRAYNSLGLAYYRRGEYDPAIEVLEKGLNNVQVKVPEFADSLANFYLKVGRFNDAIALFNKMIPQVSGERLINAYNNLGVSYLYMWDDLSSRRSQMSEEEFARRNEQILAPAAEAFSKSLELRPGMSVALDSYINVMSYRGKEDELEAAALKQISEERANFDSFYIAGKVAFNRGDYTTADQYFERAEIYTEADHKMVLFNHGYALVALKQDDRAAEKYLQAIQLDPLFIEAHTNLGLIYMGQKDYEKAFDAFSEVLRFDPNQVLANLNLATIYVSRGNNQLARNHLTTVLRQSPGNPEATTMLQQIGR